MTTFGSLEQFRGLMTDIATQMQAYLDDSSVESDQYLEGLDVTLPAAAELFNDFLGYLYGGQEPPKKVEVSS